MASNSKIFVEHKHVQEELLGRTYNLDAQTKELACLYSTCRLLEKPGLSVEEMLQGMIDFIPPAWQYPEITCARAALKGKEFKTENFGETIWKQASDITVYGDRVGSLEVCYLEERPESYEGPFLKEERRLLDAIAGRMGRNTERKWSEEKLKKAYEELEKQVRERTAELVTANDQLKQQMEEGKRTEDSLRESEERYRRITGALTSYIFTVRIEDGHPVETIHGPASVAVTGYTPEEYASDPYLWINMVHEEDREAVQEQTSRILQGQDVHSIEHRILRKDGVIRWVSNTLVSHYDTQGKLLAYDGVIQDIHERKKAEQAKAKLEAQLRQAQKMEAIGTLAGGIAHDFNNILFAVFGFVELAIPDLPEGNHARKKLGEVLKAANRAKDLVCQILTFSRQSEKERKPFKLDLIVKEGLKLLRASLPTTINIRHNIDKKCGYIMADPTQVHQVIMNLCTNAYHAMRERGGLLEVNLDVVEINGGLAGDLANLQVGGYVRLTVSDTGHGMDQGTMERIFDPFFTTKPVGEGTGMGLATVHGIVTSHGGAIAVHSELEKGTIFDVYFPRFESGVALKAEMAEPAPGGNERILFVDDEEPLVRMGQQMLERLGYHVSARTSSMEALEAFRAQPDRFDLVITDQTMPNMTGVQLARELMRIRPDIPIILITGFSEIVPPEKAKKMGIREYLMKPVVTSNFGKAIRRALDA